MIVVLVHRTLLILLAAMACYILTLRLEAWPAFGVWSVAALFGCLAGTILLRTSAVGRVTWKNRIAGYLIPWGVRMNLGRLWPLPVVSWVVWALLGLATTQITAAAFAPRSDDEPAARGWWLAGLLLAWVIDGAALLYLVGVLVQNFRPASSGGRALVKFSALIVAILVASIVLFSRGALPSAVWVAGGPPLVFGAGFGLFFGTLLLFGRNARWN